MKKRKRDKNFIRNRSGGRRMKLPGRLLSLMCALILVLSTVFLDIGHISQAYASDDEFILDTESEDTQEAGVEAQSEDTGEPAEDSSEINTELSDDFSEDSNEVITEEAGDASAADFSSGDNLSEQELTTEDSAEDPQTVTYTKLISDDTVEVKAEAPEGALPDGAELVVRPITNNVDDTEEAAQYAEVENKLIQQAKDNEQDLQGFLAYDISFVDADGQKVEPTAKVSYSFQYKEAVSPELSEPSNIEVSVSELKKNTETSELELTELKAEEDKTALETDENKKLQKADFQSADLAVFAFAWNRVQSAQEPEETLEPVGTIKVTAEEVNLREAPSTEAEIIATVEMGTQLPLAETVTTEDGSIWYKVIYDGTAAYIRSDMAEILEDTPDEEVDVQDNTGTLTFTKKINDQIQVTATTEAGVIPEDAELIVNAVEEGTDQYSDTENRLKAKAEADGYEVAGFLAYDIYFQDSEGNKLHPEDGKVRVSIDYQEPSIPEEVKETTDESATDAASEENEAELSAGSEDVFQSDETTDMQSYAIAVMHLVEDKDGNVESVVNMTEDGTASVEADADGAIQKAEFETESFSVFTIEWQDASRAGSIDTLTTVETVDHTADGITMTMTDLEPGDNYALKKGRNGTLIEFDNGGYGKGNIKYGLLENVLASNGYPETTPSRQNLSSLFSGEPVNHLFLKSVYDSTGYYEYSSFNNYAYLGNNSNFTVYDAIGTPANDDRYYLQRGNFMPYNKIDVGKFSTNTNQYDEDGKKLSDSDPAKGKKLYKTQGTNNYYFSMEMQGNFLQPKGGMATHKGTSSPMVYEFNGDDDMWVYIDNVLILDIGGVHDAHSGKINFQTGAVSWKDCETGKTPTETTTTIKAMFKKAGKFPDGTAWNDSKVNDYFTGDTFKDYSTHSFKMFYMERGAGASNLHVKFNIQVIPEGQVAVKKELSNTDKEKYSDAKFAFQLYAQKWLGTDPKTGNDIYSETEYVPVKPDTGDEKVYAVKSAVYGTDERPTTKNIEFKDVKINGKDYSNVFYLKADEEAIFTGLKANRKYYVQEIGVESEKYDKITINGTSYKEFNENEQESKEIANIRTDEKAVSERPLVVYTNNCSAANSRELQITKKLNPDQDTDDTFAFKIQLASETGEFEDYVGAYYLQDKDGYYWYYDAEGNLVKYVVSNNGNTGSDNANTGNNNTKPSRICGTTSNGIITGIRKDFTVSITGIMSGTKFKVTETDLDTDNKYENPVYEVTNDFQSGSGIFYEGNKGQIELYHDAAVKVTNTPYFSIKVNKVWTDTAEGKGSVYAGLYQKTEEDGTEVLKPVTSVELNSGNQYTGTFTKLNSRFEYVVKELRPATDSETPEFTIKNKGYVKVDSTTTVGGADYRVTYSDMVQDSSDSTQKNITITNNRLGTVEITKVDSADSSKLLKGAVFKIQKQGDDDEFRDVYDESGNVLTVTTGEDGKAKFDRLEPGVYKIIETKAPTGYTLRGEDITVKIGMGENKVFDVTQTITNSKLYSLPNSGGPGIYMFTISGVAFITAALLLFINNKRKEDEAGI